MSKETRLEKIKREREERNREIAADVKSGEYVDTRMNKQESWFPKRGIAKKDKKLIQKLYGDSDDKVT